MAVKPSTAPDSAQAEKHTKASIWDLETQFSFYGEPRRLHHNCCRMERRS